MSEIQDLREQLEGYTDELRRLRTDRISDWSAIRSWALRRSPGT